ncbi:MAG: ATP-binding protein [Bacteroidales bacterium]|jgi:NadR type nicotinamide-nucleotide adenylyltransferase
MKRVVICGPESTGKTVLSKALADYFQVPWVPEIARAYIEQLNRQYTYDDVAFIAQKQIEQDKQLEKQQLPWVIFDTWLIITKVWFEVVYRKNPKWLTLYMQQQHIDLVLLCAPDIPWVADGVRENGGAMRNILFQRYQHEIERLAAPFVVIQGDGQVRTQQAIDVIKQYHIHS